LSTAEVRAKQKPNPQFKWSRTQRVSTTMDVIERIGCDSSAESDVSEVTVLALLVMMMTLNRRVNRMLMQLQLLQLQ